MNNLIFFVPDAKTYETLSVEQLGMASGKIVWSVLTARYIKQFHPDLSIEITEHITDNSTVFFHSSYRKDLLKKIRSFKAIQTICINADSNLSRTFADASLFQNPTQCSKNTHYYVPHWPQPNIIPRDISRESKIENIEFKGHPLNIDQSFKERAFNQELNKRGLNLVLCTGENNDGALDPSLIWRDFSKADLQLAVRRVRPEGWDNKPPSKLVNGWIAGVPSLLGPESAFRHYKQSELDYIEVTNAQEALEAIDKLKANPSLYQDMIAHGFERASEFSEETIAQQWVHIADTISQQPKSGLEKTINQLPKSVAAKIRRLL